MKKLLALLLIAVLSLSALTLAACFPTEEPEEPAVEYDLAGAKDYLEAYFDGESTKTPDDYDLPAKIPLGNVTYEVIWTTDVDGITITVGTNGLAHVDLNEKTPVEVTYTLTATIKAGDGTTTTYTRTCTIPKYEVVTFEQYMAAEKGATVTVEGIVVMMNSKSKGNSRNHLFLADLEGKGGYYCYQLDNDPVEAGVEIGMTVTVTSTVEPYSGMQELKGGTFKITDSTKKQIPAAKDLTSVWTSGGELKNYVGLPVTFKGVTIGSQELGGTSEYLYFELNGKKAYVRTYVTDFPHDMSHAAENNTDKATIDAAHAAKFGWTANVTGILVLYSGNPYLIPQNTTPFEYLEYVEKTPAEKIAAELDGLKLTTDISSDTVIDVITVGKNYSDVTLAWASNNEAIVYANGKLTVTVPDTTTNVTITVTATCGETTDTKTFTVKLSKTITAIKDILTIGGAKDHNTYTEEKYLVGGIITSFANETYGNCYIKDENGDTVYVYGLYSGGKKYGEIEGAKPVVGDYVVVFGIVGKYNDVVQVKNADILSFTTSSTIESVVALGAAKEHNTYTEEKYLVTGVIDNVANTTYGNLTIKDADGNSIYVYGLYNQVGTRYDKLTVKPVAGDTVTLLAIVGKYNETVQLKNATLVAYTAAATEDDGEEEGGEEEQPTVATTIPAALEAADNTDVVVSGTVVEADTWNTTHNNMSVTIKDADGNTLYVFRLATQVALGDVITVTGKMGTYNDARQVAQGATAVVTDPAPVVVTIPEALELADNRRVIITATVKSIDTAWSEQHGNISVTVEDAEGNTLYVYRMKLNVEVGDTITITGKMGTYNGARQIASGATAVIVEDDANLTTYTLQMTYENTVYYWNGACASGKGSLTTNASEAAVLYAEATEGGYYIYYKNTAGQKIYLAPDGDNNTKFYTTDDAAKATVMIYDTTTGYLSYAASDANTRVIASYKNQDIRTYNASNIPGTSNNQYMALVAIAE